MRTYYELVEALRSRRIRLGLPHLTVDEIAGFQLGYTGKLERPLASYGRHARWETLEYWLESLGLGLAIVPAYHVADHEKAYTPGGRTGKMMRFLSNKAAEKNVNQLAFDFGPMPEAPLDDGQPGGWAAVQRSGAAKRRRMRKTSRQHSQRPSDK